jgi:hypothetical protein
MPAQQQLTGSPLPCAAQTIFFIEGGGQTGYDTNWGNGFVTDPALITQYKLSNANPFFTTLLTKPYRDQVGAGPPGRGCWHGICVQVCCWLRPGRGPSMRLLSHCHTAAEREEEA